MSTETRPAIIEYATCRPNDLPGAADALAVRGLRGAEVFMADLTPRTDPLATGEGYRELVDALRTAGVRRVHCSYWGAPTAFVGNLQFGELVERFGDLDAVREYFGDLTGQHMFARWRDEYALAAELGADAYVFHLIDYMPVDGAWAFTVDRGQVLDAMVVLTQQFLRVLEEHSLLTESSPVIELENAGWGLEFGAQTADDFVEVFERTHDPKGKLRIGWDLNHLLHATGQTDGRSAFLLPDAEQTDAMRQIERDAAGDNRALAAAWVAHNVLDARLIDRVGAIHVSDCPPKDTEYFRNGLLTIPMEAEGREAQQEAGLQLVLEHYDNHACVGDGVLDPVVVRELIDAVAAHHPIMVLHELKNATDVWGDVDRQRARIAQRP